MESVIIKGIFKNPPDGWVLLEDTTHALLHAARIWEDEPKCLDLANQYKEFQELYDEYSKYPDRDLDELARIAFQVQFLRECIEKIQRLKELPKQSPYK